MTLLHAAKQLRTAQRLYMRARADRGGQNRQYDETLRQLGVAVAEACNEVDRAIAEEETRTWNVLGVSKRLRIILYEGTDEQLAAQFAEGRGLADGTHPLATTITCFTPRLDVDTALTVLRAAGLWPAEAE